MPTTPTATITARLDLTLLNRTARACEQRGITRTDAIDIALTAWVTAEENSRWSAITVTEAAAAAGDGLGEPIWDDCPTFAEWGAA